MENILITFGVLIVVTGLFISMFSKGRGPILPGDIFWKIGNTTIYFPLTTSAIISLILTIILFSIKK